MINILSTILILLILLEIIAFITVNRLRKSFQWLITSADEIPILDSKGLEKFFKHGYDPKLGWERKPNTTHKENGRYGQTSYNINEIGSRYNPGHEDLDSIISFFGDSFAFCRQVDDHETIQWYLSELTGLGILNFGVGNYGADQAYLKMEKEIEKIDSKIIVLGVVPATITRILSVWKHYFEYGNTFAFKPRFDLKEGNLILIRNFIDSESKFYKYSDYIDDIKKKDYFYKEKFRKEIIKFPFLYYILRNAKRNLVLINILLFSKFLKIFGINNKALEEYPLMKILEINLSWRRRLFTENYSTDILYGIIDNFIALSKKRTFKPIFLMMPQKNDVMSIKNNGPYYDNFIKTISKKLFTIDLTPYLIDNIDLDLLYSNDDKYGGHFSKHGNSFIADIIYKEFKKHGLINK